MLDTVATELPRILACHGSRWLGGSLPPTQDDPTARNEGTAAHWIITTVFHGGTTLADLIGKKAPNGITITNTIAASVAEFINYVAAQGKTALWQDMEYPVVLTAPEWEVRCRPDHFTYDGITLTVDDFKHGYRIVEPRGNWTMLAYAMALHKEIHNWGSYPQNIVMRVHQPRVPHPLGPVREWRITGEELLHRHTWLNATLSNLGTGLQTGPHCEKCPSALSCPALRTAVYSALDVSMTAHTENLSDEAIALELPLLDAAEKRLKARKKQLEDLAIFRLKGGAIVHGYALERAYSNKTWKDEYTPEFLAVVLGPHMVKVSAITPTQAIIAGADEALVTEFSTRKETGLKLTRVTADEKASRMFGKK